MANSWQSSACILCECNCGIKVQIGGKNGREIVKLRGDEAHPSSKGYLCQKASGLNYYQNGTDRITKPLRRKPDGDFEEIDWDTAIKEVTSRLLEVRDQFGGDKIFYYGGGGQGNHLPGGYAAAFRHVLGSRYRSNAIAQEKTGEFWVNSHMFGGNVRGDFEHCDVALFIGKNPWHSHGIPRARAFLRELSKDDSRKLIVIDPVVTETAVLADIHLQVKPGRDAWLMAAMVAMLVQQRNYKEAWLSQHTNGLPIILEAFSRIPIPEYCKHAGIPISMVEKVVKYLIEAKGASVFEDLGIQMNLNSTLTSYLEKLLWVLCGHYGKPGAQYIPTSLLDILGTGRSSHRSPVVGATIVSNLVPCNVIADEILTDHPNRYKAMLIESANPVHSLADSNRFVRALRSLDTVVVVDVAMTETARQADYVLPAATQYEKAEATFFNFEFPENYFHLRRPLFEPLGDALPEAEIHSRFVEAAGAMPLSLCKELREILKNYGLSLFRDRLFSAISNNPDLGKLIPVILYRTLGQVLEKSVAEGAVLLPLTIELAQRESASLRRAGFDSDDPISQSEALFDAILEGASGVIISKESNESAFQRLGNNGRIRLDIPELLEELKLLEEIEEDNTTSEFPFILMAGERRDYSANTIFRDSHWRRKDIDGALRINPDDAEKYGLGPDDSVLIKTSVGSAITSIEITDRMQSGHISLPNGYGLDSTAGERSGVAVNELTSTSNCDRFVKTPHHKNVPAKIEVIL